MSYTQAHCIHIVPSNNNNNKLTNFFTFHEFIVVSDYGKYNHYSHGISAHVIDSEHYWFIYTWHYAHRLIAQYSRFNLIFIKSDTYIRIFQLSLDPGLS